MTPELKTYYDNNVDWIEDAFAIYKYDYFGNNDFDGIQYFKSHEDNFFWEFVANQL